MMNNNNQKKFPEIYTIMKILGQCYEHTRNYQKALEIYEKYRVLIV